MRVRTRPSQHGGELNTRIEVEEYSLFFSKDATRVMRKLPRNIRQNIDRKVSALAADPMAANNNVERMKGTTGFRLRVGDDWRVLYEIDHGQRSLHVHRVGTRGTVYKP